MRSIQSVSRLSRTWFTYCCFDSNTIRIHCRYLNWLFLPHSLFSSFSVYTCASLCASTFRWVFVRFNLPNGSDQWYIHTHTMNIQCKRTAVWRLSDFTQLDWTGVVPSSFGRNAIERSVAEDKSLLTEKQSIRWFKFRCSNRNRNNRNWFLYGSCQTSHGSH